VGCRNDGGEKRERGRYGVISPNRRLNAFRLSAR
jgi:hypothetical protein